MSLSKRVTIALVGLAGAGALLAHGSAASAKCLTPPIELLWSYPTDGEADVPTNAVFWSLNKHWHAKPVLSLDGVPLHTPDDAVPSAPAAVGTPLGELMPNHDYVLRLEFPTIRGVAQDDGGVPTIDISFRTGAGPAEPLPSVPVRGVQQTPDPNGAPSRGLAMSECADEVRAQSCFDTGPNTMLRFEVAEPRAVGWLVGDELWPAHCGLPSLYVRSHGPAATACTEVRAIGPGGLASEPVVACPEAAAPDASVDSNASPSTTASEPDSCALGIGANGAASAWLVALTVLPLRRRRRVSPH